MATPIITIPGIGPHTAANLAQHGFDTAEDIVSATVEELTDVPGFGRARAEKILAAAKLIVSPSEKSGKTAQPKAKPKNTAKKDTRKKKGKKKKAKQAAKEPEADKQKKKSGKKKKEKAKKKQAKAKKKKTGKK